MPLVGPLEEMAARVRDQVEGVDVALLWGYGIGIAPHDPPGLVRDLQALLGAPVVSFHALATREVRCWLRPSHADLAFASAE